MTWDGDISRMGQLAQRIGDLARVPSRAAAAVSRELGDLIEEEFAAGADPYGTAWQDLADSTKERGRTWPPLTDTSNMRDNVEVRPMRPAGVSITVPHPGAPHQTGWSGAQGTGPARPILPARSMPPRWEEVLEVEVEKAFRRAS